MCLIFNIPTGDDNDGNNEVLEIIDEKQLSTILDLITATEANSEKFLKYLGIESLEKMPKSLYQKALSALQAKEKKK